MKLHRASAAVSSSILALMCGSDGEEETGKAGEAGTGEKPAGEGEVNSSSGDGKGEKQGDPAESKRIANLTEEKERLWNSAKAEKQRADALEAELKAIQDKDKSEADKAKDRLAELEGTSTSQAETLRKQGIELAFFKSNEHKWINPAVALRLLDHSLLEVASDGTVKGMKAALDALVKSDPYLVESSKEDDKKKPPPASGTPPKGTPKGGDPGADRKKLLEKYPALRGR